MNCDFCQGEQAVLMMSNMQNGDTTAVGPFCLPFFIKSMAPELGLVVTDAEPAADSQSTPGQEGRPAVADGEAVTRKPARKRASKAAAARTPPAGGEGAPDPAGAVSGPATVNPDAAHRAMQEATGGTV